MSYQGIERRRNRVYVTRNTEYHLRDGICVAVRDRQTKAFRDAHIALRLRMEGRIKISPKGGAAPSPYEPEVGDAIFFLHTTSDGRERQITTSRIERIERPEKQDVLCYRV
jgi:hypothetical protein